MGSEFNIDSNAPTFFPSAKDDTLSSFGALLNMSNKQSLIDARAANLDNKAQQLDLTQQRINNTTDFQNNKLALAPRTQAVNAIYSELGASKDSEKNWITQKNPDGTDTGQIRFDLHDHHMN